MQTAMNKKRSCQVERQLSGLSEAIATAEEGKSRAEGGVFQKKENPKSVQVRGGGAASFSLPLFFLRRASASSSSSSSLQIHGGSEQTRNQRHDKIRTEPSTREIGSPMCPTCPACGLSSSAAEVCSRQKPSCVWPCHQTCPLRLCPAAARRQRPGQRQQQKGQMR